MTKKIITGISALILLFIISFFFWASAPVKDISAYNKINVSESTPTIQPKDTLSMITFNLGYLSGMTNNIAVDRSKDLFTGNLEKTLQLFKNIQPDFVAYQEIDIDADRSFNVNQVTELQNQHPFPYAATAVNWNKTYVPFPYSPISQQFGKIISGQALHSNYPITENNIVTLVKPENNPFYYNAFYLDRLAQVNHVKIGSKEIVIINVHLEAFKPETRDIQIKTVLKEFHKYSDKYPVILCGDFNSTPPNATTPYQNDHVIQTILADYDIEMAINLDENKRDEASYFTFNSEKPHNRIDYFFYNPKFIQILDARVLHESEQISDHLPVWMKFVLR